MPMILAGEKSSDERRERAYDLLKSVGMAERLSHHPSQLSGGEQQRVTIARAIANQPEILLLDEPTGDLDSRNTCIVLQQLLELNSEQNITMVMVTHDVGLKNFAHRVIWMRDGKIQNVEKISQKRRNQRIQELHNEYEEIKKGLKQARTKFQNTFIRRPEDYDTHPNFNKDGSGPSQYTFSEAYQKMMNATQEEYEDEIKLFGKKLKENGTLNIKTDQQDNNQDHVDGDDDNHEVPLLIN
eukprot:TRINITY_DN1505_c0_g1_i2.p1 TRINITY_DN1505_c0_g1~~TRINITY_DN1505_c0_g1_i2.p1  ORF type:complete len:241 (-),score=64.56 TRINITY_DN1505_c0_g1_i2:43-765(-)